LDSIAAATSEEKGTISDVYEPYLMQIGFLARTPKGRIITKIAAATSEEKGTISDVYEPYLMQIGFLARTPKGRIITKEACKHLGIKGPQDTLI